MKYKTKIELLQLKSLHEFPGNPQEVPADKMAMIKEDMRKHGWYAEFALIAFFDADKNMVNENSHGVITPFIISGNHRVQCAIDAGIVENPCIIIDDPVYTWEQANKDNVKYNSLHGEPDPGKLSLFLDNILDEFDLNIEDISLDIGISEEDIAQILDAGIDLNEPDEKADEVPEVKEVKSKTGDLYELNGHRVLCGDSTDSGCVDRLMDGRKADMVFTDPPYGINYKSNWKNPVSKKQIINDSNFVIDWLDDSYNGYIFCRFDSYSLVENKIKDCGLNLLNCLVWDKQSHTAGDLSSWANTHEFIVYFGKNKTTIKREQNVLRFRRLDNGAIGKSANDNMVHPNQKPVDLIVHIFKCEPFKSIVDFFIGSGSTLIACEKTNRICYGMEIDPHYCDITVQRYINYKESAENCYLIRDNEKIPIADIGFEAAA